MPGRGVSERSKGHPGALTRRDEIPPSPLRDARLARTQRATRTTYASERGRSQAMRTRAERAGFEPARELAPPTRLAGECLQPLGHLSGRLRDCMRRSVALPIGMILAFLILVLVVTQLVLPPIAASRIESRLTKNGGDAQVSVHA